MPGFVTHYIFGVNAFKQLADSEIKNIIKNHRHAYAVGLQGPDVFFYHIPTAYGPKPDVGNWMHKRDTGEFLKQLINAFSTIHEEKDYEICMAYALGYMGHYLADTRLHPYVYGRVGPAATSKVLGTHFGLETDIDRCVLQHYKRQTFSEFNHKKVINISSEEQHAISTLLHKVLLATYGVDLSILSIKAALLSFKVENLFVSDESKRKHKIIDFVEQHTVGYPVFSPLLVNDIEHMDDPCNEKHDTWSNPWDENSESTDSVYEIIDTGVQEYAECIPLMADALVHSFKGEPHSTPILDRLKNLSMTSGLDCSIELKR
jgi:hypothetical protein